MKCLILAAGYGTRMQSVVGNIPKALIPLGGRTILDCLLARLDELDVESVLITNQKFHRAFVDWRQAAGRELAILNDGTRHVDERLGAVGDIRFALPYLGVDDDLLVVAADNLFDFSLRPLRSAFEADRAVHLAVWHNPDLADQRRRGVVEMDEHGWVRGFREKPQAPRSHLAAAPLYLLPGELLDEPHRYLAAGGNPDAPGYLMEYLAARHPVRAWRIPGEILDVGNPPSYAAALRRFGDGADDPAMGGR